MAKPFALIPVVFVLLLICAFTVNDIWAASAQPQRTPAPSTMPSNSSVQTPLPTQKQPPTLPAFDFASVAIGVFAAVLTVGLIFYVFRRSSHGWK